MTYDLPPTKMDPDVKPIESLQLKGNGDREVKLGTKKLKPMPATELAKLKSKLKPVSVEEIKRLSKIIHNNDTIQPGKGESTKGSQLDSTEENILHVDISPELQSPKFHKSDKAQCKRCPYETNLKSHLELHIAQVHERLKQFQCQKCTFKAIRFSDLQQHMSKSICRFGHLSAPDQEDSSDTSFMFDFVRLNTVDRLKSELPIEIPRGRPRKGSKKLLLKAVAPEELTKLKLEPVSADDIKHAFFDEQKEASAKENHTRTRELLSTIGRTQNVLTQNTFLTLSKEARQNALTQTTFLTKSLQDGRYLMKDDTGEEAEHLDSELLRIERELSQRIDSAGNESLNENDFGVQDHEELSSMQRRDNGTIESMLDAEPPTFIKKEVEDEDLKYDQGAAKMNFRCKACGFKAAEMVDMTAHFLSEHVEDIE